jgi:hypothetical protein
MKLKYIKHYIEFINENVTTFTDELLDKISTHGIHSLTPDDRRYLDDPTDEDLEKWIKSKSDYTFHDEDEEHENYRKKLMYDEFEKDEDILYSKEKLYRIINKFLKVKPVTNNADWGGGYAWKLESDGDKTLYLYHGDGELLLLSRSTTNEEDVDDEIIRYITNSTELYDILKHYRK